MAENRRGKENRLYFTRGQMILLGGAFTLTSVIIFLIGMFVGKGIEERKIAKKEEPLVKIPVKPSSKETSGAPAAQAKDEISFNDAPSKSASAIPPSEEKTKEVKPEEKVATETKLAAKTEPPATKRAEKKVEISAPPAETAKRVETTETAAERDQNKIWRVQVNAYPDERSAKLIVDRLKNKGYKAYATEVQNRGKTWFRVSVGKYGTREEADRIVEALRSKENFTNAFVSSK
jgi:cell division septation protein DedD